MIVMWSVSTTRAEPPTTLDISTAEELQRAFSKPVTSLHVRLTAGEYDLTPVPYTDPMCGNCPDPDTRVETSTGLHIRGADMVVIEGPRTGEAKIITNAGYGILIEDCTLAVLTRITVTGGQRSSDSNATDGAIVVRNSEVHIASSEIRDNLGHPQVVRETVAGIAGIVGREGSDMRIGSNRIIRNSWDGIALYRDAKAEIADNLIDGVDSATGETIGGGRGVGIGITWNAQATVRNNLVTRYWKGIGIFVDAQAIVEGNVIEDILTWGIALWGAGDGEPRGDIRSNVIYKTGACGVSIAATTEREDAGELRSNLIMQAAQNSAYDSPEYFCAQCALAISSQPEHFVIRDNVFHDNRRASDDLPDHDDEAAFMRAVQRECERWQAHRVLRESQFVETMCDGDDLCE